MEHSCYTHSKKKNVVAELFYLWLNYFIAKKLKNSSTSSQLFYKTPNFIATNRNPRELIFSFKINYVQNYDKFKSHYHEFKNSISIELFKKSKKSSHPHFSPVQNWKLTFLEDSSRVHAAEITTHQLLTD